MATTAPDIYAFEAESITGKPAQFASQRGKVLLVVNTASKCGFTPQFAGLEKLWQDYRDRGLVVIGFPSNQFGAQDPGANDEIASFCEMNYGVTFPMMGKVDVNGDNAAPVWKWLTAEAPGILGTKTIKWNFTKFLVGKDGKVIKRFAPDDSPESLRGDIEAALAGLAAGERAMFEHVEPFGGDPILSLNEDFQKDPRPGKINLSIGIYFDDAGRIPVLDSVRRAEQQVVARDAPKPYLPIEGAANFRAAVQALLFGSGHEAIASGRGRDDPVGGLERRPQGRRRLHRPLAARQRSLGQRPELGEPPLDVRGRRPRRPRLPVLRRRDRRPGLRRDVQGAARPAREERRPAARVLPQPDRRRPDAGAVGRARADPRRGRARALPRPRLPGLRRRHRRGRVCAARPGRRTRPFRPAARASSSPTRSRRA